MFGSRFCFLRLYKGAYGEAEFWFAYVATHVKFDMH
jgi:hypothetical protein